MRSSGRGILSTADREVLEGPLAALVLPMPHPSPRNNGDRLRREAHLRLSIKSDPVGLARPAPAQGAPSDRKIGHPISVFHSPQSGVSWASTR